MENPSEGVELEVSNELQAAVDAAFQTAPPFLTTRDPGDETEQSEQGQLQLLSIVRQAEREILEGQGDRALQSLRALVATADAQSAAPFYVQQIANDGYILLAIRRRAVITIVEQSRLLTLIRDWRKRALLSDLTSAEAYRFCADQLAKLIV